MFTHLVRSLRRLFRAASPRPHPVRRARPRLEPLEDRTVPVVLPPNFQQTIFATGLTGPTSMAFSPDNKLFITEQDGTMEVWQGGNRLRADFFANTPLPTYNPNTDTGLVDSRGERGLLGVAFHPDFATNKFVYVYYTAAATTGANTTFRNEVWRYTANGTGDLALAGSGDLIFAMDNLSGATNHNGGALHFGPNGKLLIAVGDNANGADAQSLNSVHGKILRLNDDGSIPDTNPFFNNPNVTGKNKAIWARGLRNPFTFAFQPGTGRIHINDVGQQTWEEINVGKAGANYGWPATEGRFNPSSFPNFKNPFYTYRHGSAVNQGNAITGGVFYSPPGGVANRFPITYKDDYFFADFTNNWIKTIDLRTKQVRNWASGAVRPVDLDLHPDGSLLYLSRGSTGRVYKITYTA